MVSKLPNVYYPVKVYDLIMLIDKNGKILNKDVFKAVMNGYKIHLEET